ncbi:MAG: hypothetical protein ACLQGU_11990 [bacterium]
MLRVARQASPEWSIGARWAVAGCLICPGAKRVVVIPEYDDIDVDIIKSNMLTAGMTRDQYFELLKMV